MSISDSKLDNARDVVRPQAPPPRQKPFVSKAASGRLADAKDRTQAPAPPNESVTSPAKKPPIAAKTKRAIAEAQTTAELGKTRTGNRASDELEDENEWNSTADARSWQFVARLLRSTPSWLVSSIVHLLAILILALCTVEELSKPSDLVLVSGVSDEAEPLLVEPVHFDASLQNVSSISASAPSAEALGFSDVGDVSEVPTQNTGVAAGDLEVSPVGDVGDIFGSRGSGMQAVSFGKQGAEFFGVKAAGRKFVFIVDSSNSMRDGKFDDAKQELLYAIQRLTKSQNFYVIFFDADAERMRLFPNKEAEDYAVAATVENIKRTEKWVHSVELERGTNPYEAVKFALEMLPDAIYLLTDGQFTDKGKTVRFLKDNNIIDDPVEGRRPKVVVHTVGFYSRDGEENLLSISKAYGGTYRFVPRPDRKK